MPSLNYWQCDICEEIYDSAMGHRSDPVQIDCSVGFAAEPDDSFRMVCLKCRKAIHDAYHKTVWALQTKQKEKEVI